MNGIALRLVPRGLTAGWLTRGHLHRHLPRIQERGAGGVSILSDRHPEKDLGRRRHEHLNLDEGRASLLSFAPEVSAPQAYPSPLTDTTDGTDRSHDDTYMLAALELASEAASQGEVPVGAVVVIDGEIVGRGFNRPIGARDPSAHAEMLAIRDACARLETYRLPEATLYVTLEPCAMCAGLIVHSRINRLVYGAREPKAGVAESRGRFFEQGFLNHRVLVDGGVMEKESGQLLVNFFRDRRVLGRLLPKWWPRGPRPRV